MRATSSEAVLPGLPWHHEMHGKVCVLAVKTKPFPKIIYTPTQRVTQIIDMEYTIIAYGLIFLYTQRHAWE